ncbi:uncharacterized protein LOC128959310 [Oppia nitens]|uniref:uncharacterized protein LOC128959310 n=1 Tax=Oppia nitens TaxID=1686743 RepID=UPI0023DAD115|nr:uncharacterized protein LOC128959310 [Oppia nitens]
MSINKLLTVGLLVASMTYQCSLASPEWMAFHKEIKDGLCKPDTTDTAKVDRVVECKSKHMVKNADEMNAKMAELDKECSPGSEADLKAYTKVDTAGDLKRKMTLSSWCSESFHKCMKDKWVKKHKESAASGTGAGDGDDAPKKFDQAKITEFQTCIRTAIK